MNSPSELEEREDEVRAVQVANAELRERLDSAAREAREEAVTLRRELEAKEAEIRMQQAANAAMRERLDAVSVEERERMEVLHAELAAKEEEINAQQSANVAMRERLDALASDRTAAAIDGLLKQVQEKEAQIKELAAACRAREEDQLELHRVCDELRRAVDAHVARMVDGNELMTVGLGVLRRLQRFRRVVRAITRPFGGVWVWQRLVKPLVFGRGADALEVPAGTERGEP